MRGKTNRHSRGAFLKGTPLTLLYLILNTTGMLQSLTGIFNRFTIIVQSEHIHEIPCTSTKGYAAKSAKLPTTQTHVPTTKQFRALEVFTA